MANSRDFTGKNRKFTGTKGITVPKGTTGQRVGSESGELRFNTTTELMEYYDGNQWKPIDAPPTISSISTSDAQGTNNILNADGSTLYTITITGGNFGIGATVKFIGNTGTEYAAGNVTRVSNSSITCKTTASMGTTDDPYDIQVTNASGLAATLEDAFSFNAAPVFVNASGQLGTVFNTKVISGTTLNAGATDAEGNAITHTIISGTLPGSGLTLSSSTGAITGTLSGSPSLGNYPFVVRASTTEGVIERQFSIQVIALPTYSADFLVIAGGGGGANSDSPTSWGGGGGGGAGGYRNSYLTETSGGGGSSEASLTLTTNTVYTITVGAGGTGPFAQYGNDGENSVISGTGITTITSVGGGGGASWGILSPRSGGSGGGAQQNSSGDSPVGGAGTANQGYAGGGGGGAAAYGFGGGGGAGGLGGNGTNSAGGNGGPGLASSISGPSTTRAGGGGGAAYSSGTSGSGGSGGGGNAGAQGGNNPGFAATINTGSGGGGSSASSESPTTGGTGGTGVVILRVPTAFYSATTTGSPTVSTSGSDTIMIFTGSGSYTG